jgi:hypothetical protein
VRSVCCVRGECAGVIGHGLTEGELGARLCAGVQPAAVPGGGDLGLDAEDGGQQVRGLRGAA